RLAAFTGAGRYEVPAEEVLRGLGALLAEHATAFAYLLGALERLVTPPLEVAIVGPDADGTDALRREVYGRLLPASVTVKSTPEGGDDFTPLLADRALVDGKPTAYVCEHFACRQPVTTPEDLREEIDAALAARRGG
ncbi:MAG TPA: thioredoxin domain-containing protein, partial [Acidimicrobiia bacterium]|nr:thioredoxin domain-containing protein [Acidimicrobiia bacterium]